MGKLNGKVAVVTGASKGIGAAIAEDLAKEGASVVINYSSSGAQANKVVEKIKASGGKAKAVGADVSKPAEAKKLIDAAVAEFGKLDILVNNAGVYEFLPLTNVSEAHYDRIFGINVKGLLFTTQAALEKFNGSGGSIINVSSVVSTSALPGSSVYSATKAAIDSFTRTLSSELGPKNIRVNSVQPGPVETEGANEMPDWEGFKSQIVPRTPLGRVGYPKDVAPVVSFLASDESAWITGQEIATAGGLRG